MAKGRLELDAQATAKVEPHKRRVIHRTRVVDSGEGKRIWKRLVVEFEFEGYTPIEITAIYGEDLAETFSEDLRYPRIGLMSKASVEKTRLGVVAPRSKALRRANLGEAVHPSIANTFLAIAALAITAVHWLGLSIRLAVILGAVVSAVLTGAVYRLRTRTRLKGS